MNEPKDAPVIRKDRAGKTEVVWQNTFVDKPTLQDMIMAAVKEFPGTPADKLHVLSGIMSLTLKESTDIL